MFGDSYYGFTQWAAVAGGHPALRAIVPRVTSADLATMNWSGEGVTALYGADYLAHYWVDNPIYDFAVDWSHRPLAEVFDEAFAAIGARSRGFDILLARETRGTPSPDPFPEGHPFDRLRVPVLHSVGWFDNLAPDSMRDYMTLARRPDRAGLQYLVVDSIDHENYRLDDVPFSPDGYHDTNDDAIARMIPVYLEPALEFFDAVLGRPPRGAAARALAPRQRRLARVGGVAAERRARAATLPRRREPGGRRAGRRLAPARGARRPVGRHLAARPR